MKKPLILAVDCGMKYNIVRFFIHYLKVNLKACHTISPTGGMVNPV